MTASVDDALAEAIVAGYARGASIRELARSTGRSRAVVRAVITAAGYQPAPRGAGRPRLQARSDVPCDVVDAIRALYVEGRHTRREIAERLGVADHTVRTVLGRDGVRTRSRGRLNREDRTRLPRQVLEQLYVREQLTVAQVAQRLQTSRGVVSASLHENGIAVRRPNARRGGKQVRVLAALYADPEVGQVLDRVGVPRHPLPGPLAVRFPDPVPLTKTLLCALYVHCGLSTSHIELLTGQPAVMVQRRLASLGIPLRRPGGLSPWRRRISGLPT